MAALCTFRQEGDLVPYTPASAVTEGDVVVQGELVGVVHKSIAAGGRGDLMVSGIIRFPKATTSGSAITAGAEVYWDEGNLVATTTASGNKKIGKCVTAAAATTDSTVDVRMSQ